MPLTLVLGGTKTGKTTFAENRGKLLSEEQNCSVHYIATAIAFDNEMKVRIKKHVDKRPSDWVTIEETINVSGVISSLRKNRTVIILDCLTLLMTNLLFKLGEDSPREESENIVFTEIDKIISESSKLTSELIIISNQVENGLVSEHKWARMFQDLAGISHQKLAKAADHVYIMNAGLPFKIK